ncbi:hypothetical protein [Vibrio scophthalmi]|uniref:Uncharacterized protein n=1 Tax=Vibrio scophthalmi LMG 19158 TaxID=870967 RepID=F9RJX5_9VIBR|nr:hypothetical protein [Vibrio scophthalmi]EGU40307.1 hypothetical protein VIS19158_00910 [Vibrio scophthalmi LMG 19158]
MKQSLVTLHKTCAVLAFIMIASFFSSSLISELFADHATVASVKYYISWAVWGVLPLMAMTGITGSKMAPKVKSGVGPIGRKKKRMPIIAVNGLLILLPCAMYLNVLASQGLFDQHFYLIQGIELIAGSINLTLMALNIRDGLTIKKPKIRK